MRKRSRVFDSEGIVTGTWTSSGIADEEGSIRNLLDQQEGCTECDYEGPLKSTRKGWRCPSCREIIIPNLED